MTGYPPEAFAPNGELWWLLLRRPGSKQKFGGESKLAAYLYFNLKVGDVFTLRQLRESIPGESGAANDQEHFNRRLRNLRKYDWVFASGRDDATLAPSEYRLKKVGHPVWLGTPDHRPRNISAKLRRQVLDRDGNRCVICGVGAGEPYPEEPDSKARMTIGHYRADLLKGAATLDNLRVECSRCNEPVGNQVSNAESVDDVWPKIVKLSRADKTRLVEWMDAGMRTRSEVERIYDLIRSLPAGQRDDLLDRLRQAI